MQDQRQRMQTGTEFFRQQVIDQPVPRHPVQSVKTRTRNGDVEMRLASTTEGLGSGVMGMAGAVILDFELCGGQSLLKKDCNPFASTGGLCGRM